MIESLTRDIATIIADKCVNPTTKRPYTVTLILAALRDTHFSVNVAKSAKQQALKAVKALKDHISIERARMQVRVTVPVTGVYVVRGAHFVYPCVGSRRTCFFA